MRLITIACLLFAGSASFGQQFQLEYWIVGLGSNRIWPGGGPDSCRAGLRVKVEGTDLTYSICEDTDAFLIRDGDTIWKERRNAYTVKIRQSTIDSILSIAEPIKGKYVYRSNYGIMSGGVFNLTMAYQDWCTQITMKNTSDSIALQIAGLLNEYLDNRNHIRFSQWAHSKEYEGGPLIEDCTTNRNDAYRDLLEQDYDIIRNEE